MYNNSEQILIAEVKDGRKSQVYLDLMKFWILADEAEEIRKVSRMVDIICFTLLGVVAATVIFLIVYFTVIHKKTKKGVRNVNRFNGYQTADATISSIEKVPYYVSPYEKPDPKTDPYSPYYLQPDKDGKSVNLYRTRYFGKNPRFQTEFKKQAEEIANAHENSGLAGLEKKEKAVEKFRYNVLYEFSVGNGNNLYSGNFFAYEENEDLKVGKALTVKYDPSNPMVNFTSYNSPVGV